MEKYKTAEMTKFPKSPDTLFQDLRTLIIEARQDVARQVNSALVLLYWRVGKRIRQDILKEKRAEYGEEILSTLSRKLIGEFGNGFSTRNLWHMIRFAETFPDEKIVNSLSTQLGWTHFRHILALNDPLKRDFLIIRDEGENNFSALFARECLLSATINARGLQVQKAVWQPQHKHVGPPVGHVKEHIEIFFHPRVRVSLKVPPRVVVNEARGRDAGARRVRAQLSHFLLSQRSVYSLEFVVLILAH
jgi:hypothetical protein